MSNDYESIGEAAEEAVAEEIRVALLRAHMTQAQLAEALGVSTAYVSRRLSGEVALTVGDVAAVAAVLGTSVADLVAGVPKGVG